MPRGGKREGSGRKKAAIEKEILCTRVESALLARIPIGIDRAPFVHNAFEFYLEYLHEKAL